MDVFRPDQRTPVPNFFLAGSYTKQDYIDRWVAPTPPASFCSHRPHDRRAPAGGAVPTRLPSLPFRQLLLIIIINPFASAVPLRPACSMEGATLSGRQCAYKIVEDVPQLAAAAAKQQQQAVAA